MVGAILSFLMFEGVGGLFAWLGYSNLTSNRSRRKSWLFVQGSVTGLKESRSKRTTFYAPVYRYDIDGQERTGVSDVASSPAGYRVGDAIQLLVNPEKTAESMVLGSGEWAFSWVFLLMGLLTVAAGLLVAVLILSGAGQ